MARALVAGGNGFIGSFLVERLLKEGFEVHCLVRKRSDLRFIKDLPVKIFFGELIKPNTLIEPLKDIKYVFHIAAKKRAFKESQYDEVNETGTLNLLEASKNSGAVKKFIYVSSLAVMGPNANDVPWTEEDPCKPISFYGKSKLKGEEAAKQYQSSFSVTILRPPPVYGPRDLDLLPIFNMVKMRIKPQLGRKEQITSLVYVEDLADAIFEASQTDKASGKTYFVCDRKQYSFNEIIDQISVGLKRKGINIIIPGFLLYTVAFINQIFCWIFRKPPVLNVQKASELLQAYWMCSSKKIEKELGFVTKTSLPEGIKKSIDWYRANKLL